jgi:hypothetical protein
MCWNLAASKPFHSLHLVARAVTPITLPGSAAHSNVHVVLAQDAATNVLDLGLARASDRHKNRLLFISNVVGESMKTFSMRIGPLGSTLLVVHNTGSETSLKGALKHMS